MTRRVSAALLLAGLSALPSFAENWPQWRGPKNDGHSSETGLPAEWGPDKNVVWKVPMPGPGASTPAIWGDRMYFTAQAGSEALLLCYGTDGKPLWKQTVATGGLSKMMKDEGGNLASASCTTDGKRVFAYVGTGDVGAYDSDSGKPIWEQNLQNKYGKFEIQFGGHWTPVLYKDRLYLAAIHRKGRNLIALDAATGNEVWKASRASDSPPGVESPDVYASPFIWEGAEGPLLIVQGDDYCTGHKLEDGSEVWRVAGLNPKERYNRAWRAVSSPLVTPDLIVVPSCKNGVTVGVNPHTAKGTIIPGNSAEIWRLPKGTPDVSSPLIVDDLLYLMKETGGFDAYEAKTGKPVYAEKVTNERHRASPVFADGKIILVGRDGTMGVVKPGREFDLIAKNKLPDTFTASPAISGGRIYLRGWNCLWAIGTK